MSSMQRRIAPALMAAALAVHARVLAAPAPAPPAQSAPLDAAAGARFAALALKCLHQEYPNHLSHTLNGAADARPPHELTPAFFGCFDWHSDVHGHWLLVRLLRLFPAAPYAAEARAQLAQSFTPENIAHEVSYLRGAGRASFERPYGLAWLLELSAELRQWDDRDARSWSATLAPLESEVAARLAGYLPRLYYPIRIGEHDQTAFALGLIWDWAAVSGDTGMQTLLTDSAQRFYARDRDCPLAYEPSGEDFLSPCLAEADFMRRVLAPGAFAHWLTDFLPQIPGTRRARETQRNAHAAGGGRGGASPQAAPWLTPGIVTDRADPKLAHIDGLNLSRAWMLQGIAHGLPPEDPRTPALRSAAAAHADAALPAVTGEHYEGGHWLGTFAVYLSSQAGLAR
jgi:Protein of unknown function (DUF2891)